MTLYGQFLFVAGNVILRCKSNPSVYFSFYICSKPLFGASEAQLFIIMKNFNFQHAKEGFCANIERKIDRRGKIYIDEQKLTVINQPSSHCINISNEIVFFFTLKSPLIVFLPTPQTLCNLNKIWTRSIQPRGWTPVRVSFSRQPTTIRWNVFYAF